MLCEEIVWKRRYKDVLKKSNRERKQFVSLASRTTALVIEFLEEHDLVKEYFAFMKRKEKENEENEQRR